MNNILFLKTISYFSPEEVQNAEKYRYLSSICTGNIIAIVHKKEYKHFKIGNITLIGIYLPKYLRGNKLIIRIIYYVYSIIYSIILHKTNKQYHAVIACDPLYTGVLANIIGLLLNIKIIIEINGIYNNNIWMDIKKENKYLLCKNYIVGLILPRVINNADAVKLLYKDQLTGIHGISYTNRITSFHDFVPIKLFHKLHSDNKYILFVGYPWYLKGVDILIKSFNIISSEFPEYSLKIVGHCPDRKYFESLAGGNKKIEFYKAVFYEDVIKMMGKSSLFILPSRTESMGRVLLEAMASRTPIIASMVDGIPYIIKDSENGFLFESENVNDLVEKMRRLMSNGRLAEIISENGFKYVQSCLSEEVYVQKYKMLLEDSINNVSFNT